MIRTIQRKCLHCEKDFQVAVKEVNRGYGKFCSRNCGSSYPRPKKPNVTCANCGSNFYKNSSQQKGSKSGLFFCTRKCKDTAQRIGGIKEIQPSHYGIRTKIVSSDYRPLAFESYKAECNRCGYKKYSKILVVHHKDRNRFNNDILNLEILCPTCHDEEHLVSGDGRFRSAATEKTNLN